MRDNMNDSRPLRYKSVDYKDFPLGIGEGIDLPAPDGNIYPYRVTGHDFRAKPKTQVEMDDPGKKVRCKFDLK
jgi:hypothetical protein